MRKAQVDLAIRWFIGPCTRRCRITAHAHPPALGRHVFRRVFTGVVRQCQAAGLVSPRTVSIDASLIRAHVGMDALVAHHPDAVETANDAARDARSSGTFKRLCRTDPDATLATSSKARLAPGLQAAQGPRTTLRASWWTWRSSWGDRHGRGT
jgi:hypothetical protein